MHDWTGKMWGNRPNVEAPVPLCCAFFFLDCAELLQLVVPNLPHLSAHKA